MVNLNNTPRGTARKLTGTLAIALAAGVCAIGIGPSAVGHRAPGVEGIAFSAASPSALAVGRDFHANDDGFTVNDVSGDSITDDTQFAVGTLALSDAETIAIHYWGVLPCQGVVDVSWDSLDPSINGVASWWNPVDAYSDPVANADCSISLNTAQDFSWPMLCTVVTHEFGHLTGHEHVLDQTNVMYPVYVGPIPQCLAPPIGVPAPVTAAAPASSPAPSNATATAASRKAKETKREKEAKALRAKKAREAKVAREAKAARK